MKIARIWRPESSVANAVAVGFGLGAVGTGSVAAMAVAARALNQQDFAEFATWWTVANLVGLAFGVVEAYLPRLIIAASSVRGDDAALLARFARTLALAVAVAAVLAAVAAPWTLSRLFADDVGLLLLAVVYMMSVAVQTLQRAAAIGRGRFEVFAFQLGADGSVRLVGSVIAAAAGAHSPRVFAAILCAAAALSLFAGTPPNRHWFRWANPATHVAWTPMAFLFVASLGPLVVNNVAVPWLSATQHVSAATIGAVAGALTLSRVPTLLVGSAYGPVLTPLARAVEARAREDFRRIHRAASVIAIVLALGFVAVFAAAGPRLLQLYLGPAYELPVVVLAVMGAGSGLMFVCVVEQAALVAMSAWTPVARAWLSGLVAFGISLALPMDPVDRVAAAVCLGPLVAAVVMGAQRYRVERSVFS